MQDTGKNERAKLFDKWTLCREAFLMVYLNRNSNKEQRQMKEILRLYVSALYHINKFKKEKR
jgi:hypothetical protein